MRSVNLKPQDVVLAVHLLSDSKFRKQTEYASELGLSQAEISASLKRLVYAGLLDRVLLLPYRDNLEEFLVHGLKYVFPAEYEVVGKGIPTASSFSPLNDKMRSSGLPMVWKCADGNVQGQGVKPLIPSVPSIVKGNIKLHERLALVDSIRTGKPRERQLAISLLKEMV